MTGATTFALVVALASAFLMGLAIQRGATCMVAAVDEALVARRYDRAGALGEAALWVGGLVAVLEFAGLGGSAHPLFPVTAGTVAGGALLGLGAWINRACVFGSVARIGSGQWAWLATPVGFFLGCLVPIASPGASGTAPPIANPAIISLAFSVLVAWRLIQAVQSRRVVAHLWHPHRATLLIGVTFVTTMLAVGAWAYTDALAAIARPSSSMDPRFALRGAMVVALLAGAIMGGRVAKALSPMRARLSDVTRCLAGGAMMGIGSQLVPGSNDGLIMQGLPLLLPHAWAAVATMTITICCLIGLSRLRARTSFA